MLEGLDGLGLCGEPALMILYSVAGGAMDFEAIATDIAALGGSRPARGALYRSLAHLEVEELVELTDSGGGRRPYRLTSAGAKVLEQWLHRLRSFSAVGLDRVGSLNGTTLDLRDTEPATSDASAWSACVRAPGVTWRRVATMALAISGALVTACGGGTTTPPASPTTIHTQNATATTTTKPDRATTTTVKTAAKTTLAPATTTVPATPTPTAVPTTNTTPATTTTGGVAPCQVNQLSISFNEESGGIGHTGAVVAFQNISATPCFMSGYPGLTMLDDQHAALPTSVVQGNGALFKDPGTTVVTLAPSQSASTGIEWSGQPSSSDPGGACATSHYIDIVPPNATTPEVVAASITACGLGTIYATAIQSGSAGPAT